jgi:hypothetical protein
MKKFNRRKFIRNSAAYSFLGYAVESYVRSLISPASINSYAGGEDILDKYYVGINFHGGPARWMFDLPLYKNSTEYSSFSSTTPNPMVITGWETNNTGSGGGLEGKYELIDMLGMKVPPIWTGKSSLLDNTIFVRGLKNLSIHPAWESQFMPRLGSLSIPGIISNYASSTVPCINFGVPSIPLGNSSGNNAHIVEYNGAWSEINATKSRVIPKELILPFKQITSVPFSENSDQMKDIRKALKKIAISNNFNNKALYQSQGEAKDAMLGGLEYIVENFVTAFEEYQNAHRDAMNTIITGLDDRPLKSNSSAVDKALFSEYINSDFTDIIKCIRKGNSTATNNQLCAGLALAETLINSQVKISRSFVLNGGTLFLASEAGLLDHDGHGMGAAPSCLFYSKFFQGVINSLDLFKSRIGNSNFSNTLIHLSSEFNRSARFSGDGSDHGGDGSNTTIITGITPGKKILGEVDYSKENDHESYRGIWGQSSNEFSSEMVSNLIEYILGVPSGKMTFKSDDQLTKLL